jgi:hypothetical protein
MTTASDIVTGALRFLKVLAVGDSVDAASASATIDQLNDYLNGLNARGAVYPSGTLALGDTVDIPDELVGDLKRALAKKCEGDFGQLLQGPDRAEAVRSDQRIVAYYTTVYPAGQDLGLGQMPSQRRAYLTGRLV